MLEFASDPRGGVQTLLDYGSSHPWAAGLTITLAGSGTLTLSQWQGDQRRVHRLATDVLTVKPSVTVTYTWDAPLRRGVLALEVGDSVPVFAELIAPLPLSMRDGARMMADARHCAVNSGATFVAIADEVMPIGVPPTLGGDTMIQTPSRSVKSAGRSNGHNGTRRYSANTLVWVSVIACARAVCTPEVAGTLPRVAPRHDSRTKSTASGGGIRSRIPFRDRYRGHAGGPYG